MDRADIVHEAFLERLSSGVLPEGVAAEGPLKAEEAVAIFRAQCLSRNLDRRSRKMQAQGQGYYTIGSSGHEGMAAVASALRPDDMAFLHYRDGAFQTRRSAQVPGTTPAWDMLLSFATSMDDPISGGRHKVLGSKALNIPPQTSTIASHLPKAVGAAYSVGLAKRVGPEHQVLKDDSIVMCSFGDASSNHSTAQGAINTACWTSFQSVPMPLLFVCEDNGIGISTRTPRGWVAANYENRPGLKYFHANGLDIFDTWRAARAAAEYVRCHKKPAFLHLTLVRLYGHAGSDMQQTYLSKDIFEAWEAEDPLMHSARLLRDAGVLTADEIKAIYLEAEAQCTRVAEQVVTRPRLKTAEDVMASIIPPARDCAPSNGVAVADRENAFGKSDLRAMGEPQPMSRLINWALTDLMLEHREIAVMGEDVGAKGGVYGVTQKLCDRFGPDRVIDTLLDEQSILGLAIGMAHNGFVPMPEIQFLAYLHNAEDQIRGEAATLSFFSNGQYTNPMVLRIAGLGYQKGFGGHFHNDNSLAVLRDIPGVIIACPSHGADAAKMLRECVRLARVEQRVVVFIEPIALYPMRDLHDAKDSAWMDMYPAPDEKIALGEVGVTGDGALAIVTYGNGNYLSQHASKVLAEKGIQTRVIDMRWLAPMPVDGILNALGGAEKVLVVDECRTTGSQSEALLSMLHERCDLPSSRIAAEDSFIATGPAYAATMPSSDSIADAAIKLWEGK
ncbi:dehydrogenase E1 component subunit alpha/beta [Halocynthiibacter styelae]|uniref:2-oxoglutarate dehydrogenase E1 component n=1 Tax=Halocynthiibacter styelae TaxID=2761955 RepID=A0A8J7IV43_9RHOB|nr:thiamine pyrophosphate-dependent enzyme [Paenihalocynthiibacter styelae]MBI1493083.1 MFS transporter [Paenihalocynthiibacter styelae]